MRHSYHYICFHSRHCTSRYSYQRKIFHCSHDQATTSEEKCQDEMQKITALKLVLRSAAIDLLVIIYNYYIPYADINQYINELH